jgi:hypothetical protein
MSSPEPWQRGGMMPRNDTWRGRDAHRGLAEGLGPWRVGWSGPGRIGVGGSRRWAGPSRRPPGARGVRAGSGFRGVRGPAASCDDGTPGVPPLGNLGAFIEYTSPCR